MTYARYRQSNESVWTRYSFSTPASDDSDAWKTMSVQKASTPIERLKFARHPSCTKLNPFTPSVPLKRHLQTRVDPDQTPQNATSDQGLHCLHLVQKCLLNDNNNKTKQTPLLIEMDRSKELR